MHDIDRIFTNGRFILPANARGISPTRIPVTRGASSRRKSVDVKVIAPGKKLVIRKRLRSVFARTR